jgi:hypothetical protein
VGRRHCQDSRRAGQAALAGGPNPPSGRRPGLGLRHRHRGRQKRRHGATGQNRVKFELDGPGEIVATDNGDATSFEPFQSSERNAFNGLAIVIVRAKAGQSGTLRSTLNHRPKSDGLMVVAPSTIEVAAITSALNFNCVGALQLARVGDVRVMEINSRRRDVVMSQ